jgi:transglutaminase-like putative cysteine protease
VIGIVALDPGPVVEMAPVACDHAERPPSMTPGDRSLRLQVGCVFELRSANPTSAVLQVAPHDDQDVTIESERWDGVEGRRRYRDGFGNHCERFELPPGESRIEYTAEVALSDQPDLVAPEAVEVPPGELPDDVLSWTMPSRFCQPDELGSHAWERFGDLQPGWSRVQAICDFVHEHLDYVVGSSNPWTTSADVFRARQGVCRDFTHLAVALCRALNIPARYVFGYVPGVGAPAPDDPMDFSAWFEAYLSGGWYTFDARLNEPRIGRVVVGRGRDAVDVAILTTFGPVELAGFEVQADQID